MAEQTFNEAEQFLLQNWATTIEVEDSISEVRTKYEALCERIAEGVAESHKELDIQTVKVLITAGPAAIKSGVIVVGRSSWPSEGKIYQTAFWVENLRLEVLLDEDEDDPMVGFWLQAPDDSRDFAADVKAIQGAAKKILTSEQLSQWHLGNGEETAIVGRVVASKQELLAMLSKGETERFVDTIVEQLEELATLIPAIDGVLGTTPKTS
jgi:hypothetical protein